MAEYSRENPETSREVTGTEKIARQMVFDFPQTPDTQIPKNLKDLAVYAKDARVDKISPTLESPEIKIRPATTYALTGPNGSGKSTFFDALTTNPDSLKTTKLIRHGKAPNFRVSRLLQETDLKPIEDLAISDAVDQLATYYAYEDTAYQDRPDYNPNAPGQISERLLGLFDLNLTEGRGSLKVRDLSGGERTKLCLMIALMSNPDMLLLDEPNNHLDLSATSMLKSMISQLKAKGVTVVFSSHSEDFIKSVDPDEIFSIQADAQSRKLTQKEFDPDELALDGRANRAKAFDERWGRHGGQEKLSASIDIHGSLVNLDIDLAAPVCLLGKSGIGKTTLLEQMQRAVKQSSESNDEYVSFAYLPQTWPEQITNGNLETFFEWCHQVDDDEYDKKRLPEAKQKFLKKLVEASVLPDAGPNILNQPFSRFSGGEQRLLWFIAIEAADKHNFLVLDEPTNHADKALKETIGNAMKNFTGNVMYTTHDVALVEHMATGQGRSKVQVLELAKNPTFGAQGKPKLAINYWGDNFGSEDFEEYIEKLNQDAARATDGLFD